MGRAPATREPGIKKRVVIINTPPDVGLDVNDTYRFIPFRSGSQPFGANKSNCCSSSGPKCDARMFRSELLEDAIHHELSRFVPTAPMHAAFRNRLGSASRSSTRRNAKAISKRCVHR